MKIRVQVNYNAKYVKGHVSKVFDVKADNFEDAKEEARKLANKYISETKCHHKKHYFGVN